MRVHIVSHSHWDREWYESFTAYRMKLVELIDDVIEIFEKDSAFQSFHLDGQLVILEDYLQIKPQNKEKLKKLVLEKKLIIGPFYVLQDEFLITGEENARNSLVGSGFKEEWKEICPIGYFPDTFGHIDQLAQLCKLTNLKYIFFGRGVKPIGFDNQVIENEKFSSNYSEMYLESPDGSKVLGILFANWYSNGNEIPVDKKQAKIFWDKKIQDALHYASTDSLLFMNGCDHQPVQKNLSQALKVARELYPDITFIHSSLEEYAKEIESKLPKDIKTIKGEMTSQETDGWYTLTNTASSRIYLKEENIYLSELLTMVAEPLSVIVDTILPYKKELFQFAWKELIKNLAHDSICGCSIDTVHKEMMVRFEQVKSMVHYIIEETFHTYAKTVDTCCKIEGAKAFLLYNPSPNENESFIDGVYPIEKYYFSDSALRPDQIYHKLEKENAKEYILVDKNGERISAIIEFIDCHFGYDLPKNGFRMPYIARRYRICLYEKLEAMTEKLYFLKPVQEKENIEKKENVEQKFYFENKYFKLEIKNHHVVYYDKLNHLYSDNFIQFEDCGDIGNEYIFKAPRGDMTIHANLDSSSIKHREDGFQEWILKWEIYIPKSANQLLEREEKGLVEFRDRKAQRSSQKEKLEIETKILLSDASNSMQINIHFKNKQKNHRFRVIVDSMRDTKKHFADSSFSIVERENEVSPVWENPSNPQHMIKLVGMENEDGGILVSSLGLHEYEIENHRFIAITLLRATGELGDWGYFPTKDSQELGDMNRCIIITTYRNIEKQRNIKRRLMTGIDILSKVLPINQNVEELFKKSLYQESIPQREEIFYTAFKKFERNHKNLIRYVNLSNKEIEFSVCSHPMYFNLIEEEIDIKGNVRPMEIRTEIL